MNRRTTPAPCTYPKFGCATPPPPGYAECTRMCGHDGPCAMDFAPTIIGEAEKLYVETKAACMRVGENLGRGPVAPDYIVLPWRTYWGWIFGRYSQYYPFTCTRIYLNPFRLVAKVHWTVYSDQGDI